jgi:hypothetical protein
MGIGLLLCAPTATAMPIASMSAVNESFIVFLLEAMSISVMVENPNFRRMKVRHAVERRHFCSISKNAWIPASAGMTGIRIDCQ